MTGNVNKVEWTVFLFETRQSSVSYIYNQYEYVYASTRAEALEKSKKFNYLGVHLIGVSLIPTAEHNALNYFNWKKK